MEKAAWPFRLWGVRHIRALILTYKINRHYDMWRSMGMLPSYASSDWEIVDRIRAGEL